MLAGKHIRRIAAMALGACPYCGGAVAIPERGKVVNCPKCAAVISRSGIKVEGTNHWQVLIVASALILLLFVLAVVWRLIFG
jgi:predicted RNA-binding Zn-ribbon protein involved in translation (DUF1610 family)